MKKQEKNIRILILNDNEGDTKNICEALAKSDIAFDIEIAKKQNEFLKKLLKMEPDIIISNPLIKKYPVLEIYDDARKAAPYAYFILECTQSGKEEMNKLILSGIDYFLPENNYDILMLVILQGFNKKNLEKDSHASRMLLIEGNQRLRSIFNHDQNAVFIIGFTNEIIDYNPAALEALGMKNSEALLGTDISKYIDKSDIKKFRAAHAMAFRGKKSINEFTLSLSKTIKKQVSINFVPLKNEDEVPTSVILICKDVSEAFLLRQKYKLSEERFMALANNAPVGIYYNNLDGRRVFVNKKWTESTGLSFRESLGKGWLNSIHPDDKEYVKEFAIENRIKFKELKLEFRVLLPSGEVKWLREISTPFVNENGKEHGFIGTVSDITKDKLHAIEIVEAQKRQELSIKLAGLGVVERDLLLDKSKWSAEVYKIFELEVRENNPGLMNAINQYLHPEDREYVRNTFKDVHNSEEIIKADFRIITRPGKIKYLKTVSVLEKNIDGKPERLVSVIQDITNQKLHIKELQDAKQRKETAMTLADIALWEIDLTVTPNMLEWGNHMFSIFERDKSLGSPENREFLNTYVHPEDRGYVSSLIKNYVPGSQIDDFFYRAVTPSGKLKYLRALVTSENDLEGRPNRVLGFIQDITTLRQGEEDLKVSEEKFRYIFNHSPDAIYIEDLNGTILEVNERACMLQEMQKEELVGKNILDLAPATIGEEIKKKFRLMAKGDISILHSYSWNKSGKKIPVQIKQNQITYNMMPALLLHVRILEN